MAKSTKVAKVNDTVIATPAEESDAGLQKFDPKDAPKRTRMEIMLLTQEICEDFLKSNIYKTQRKKMPRRLSELVRKAKDGRYHGGEVVMAHTTFDYFGSDGKATRRILMNGQHTLEVPKQTGKPELACYKEFICETNEQLICLWGQFDAPGGVRTISQILAGYQEYLPGWPLVGIKQIVSALADTHLAMTTNPEEKAVIRNMTADEKALLVFEDKYAEAANFAAEIIYKDNARNQYPHLDRSGVARVCIESFIERPDHARTFWSKVKFGMSLSHGNPELALRNFLMNVSVGNTSGKSDTGRRRKVISGDELYLVCLRMWNHAKNGQSIDRVQLGRTRKKVAVK